MSFQVLKLLSVFFATKGNFESCMSFVRKHKLFLVVLAVCKMKKGILGILESALFCDLPILDDRWGGHSDCTLKRVLLVVHFQVFENKYFSNIYILICSLANFKYIIG